jgi:hypothetical protein
VSGPRPGGPTRRSKGLARGRGGARSGTDSPWCTCQFRASLAREPNVCVVRVIYTLPRLLANMLGEEWHRLFLVTTGACLWALPMCLLHV